MSIALRCPYCGFSKEVHEEKIPRNVKKVTCPSCRQSFELPDRETEHAFGASDGKPEFSHPDTASADGKNDIRTQSPWENRAGLGLWKAIFETLKEVLFSPGLFFRRLQFEGSRSDPLAFGLLTGSIGGMFSMFWQLLITSGGMLFLVDAMTGRHSLALVFLAVSLVIPIFVLIGLFISSAVWHLFLLLFRGAGNGFEATFRLVCYSQSAQVFGIIPFVGGWVSIIWQIVVQIIGLKEIHETAYSRVILAFLIPFVFIGLIAIAAVVFIVVLVGR